MLHKTNSKMQLEKYIDKLYIDASLDYIMPTIIKISKTELLNLYEKQKLSSQKIAKQLECSKTTILNKLKKSNIKIRLPGTKRINISKKQLENLYLHKKLSTWQIEEQLKIPRSTIHRKLKKFNITIRDRSESHIVYPKMNFSENEIEKAYLIGFRIGDLGVRKQHKNSKTICIASGSTIPEQIELIKTLFESYGHVWIKKTKNNKINIQTIVNESFTFLLSKDYPKWIEKDRNNFFSFLAGFIDAEGCIGKTKNKLYFSIGNYEKELLFKIHKNLNKYQINCKEPRSDNRMGTFNSQGYPYRSNYWSLKVHKKKDLLRLYKEIQPLIKHKNKIKALNRLINDLILKEIRDEK